MRIYLRIVLISRKEQTFLVRWVATKKEIATVSVFGYIDTTFVSTGG